MEKVAIKEEDKTEIIQDLYSLYDKFKRKDFDKTIYSKDFFKKMNNAINISDYLQEKNKEQSIDDFLKHSDELFSKNIEHQSKEEIKTLQSEFVNLQKSFNEKKIK